MCPTCTNLNFQFREQCNQCGVPKPEGLAPVAVPEPGLQPGQNIKPGDWKCGSCANVK